MYTREGERFRALGGEKDGGCRCRREKPTIIKWEGKYKVEEAWGRGDAIFRVTCWFLFLIG